MSLIDEIANMNAEHAIQATGLTPDVFAQAKLNLRIVLKAALTEYESARSAEKPVAAEDAGLIKLLRERSGQYDEYGWHAGIEREAADRIAALSAEVQRVKK